MNTNKNHILTAKQEKLISRLAMLSGSRKEAGDVSVSFFKTSSYSTGVSMAAFNSKSAIFVAESNVLDNFLFWGGECIFQFKASNFRASRAFNNLGLLANQESEEDLRVNELLASPYLKRLDFYKIIAQGNQVTQLILDFTYLPRRLHSIFVEGKYSAIDSKSVVLATKILGLEVLYISERKN